MTKWIPYKGLGGVIMVTILTLSAEDHEFESRSGKIKDYQIGIAVSPLSIHH